jgi:VWFA-related protein
MFHRISAFLILVGMTLPTFAASRVSVQQLEQTINATQNSSDEGLARQLRDLHLTERLGSARLARLMTGLPGEKSRQALTALADEAAFLDPPAAEIPRAAAPSVTEQRRMMGLVVAYVSKTLPQLPNLFATRNTMHFLDSPQAYKAQDELTTPFRPLHFTGAFSVNVLYRDGRERIDAKNDHGKEEPPAENGLNTWGEFGPILSTVLLDAAQNRLVWSHWEQGQSGLLAVVSYAVPKEKSHYEVDYCCVADSEGADVRRYRQRVGYHGEMTIDPATGAILRLKIEADIRPGEPVAKASLIVEYGPVQIGGESYICPLKGIALSVAQTTSAEKDFLLSVSPMGAGGGFKPSLNSVVHSSSATTGPEQTLLNDITFGDYHVLRADAHILVPGEAVPADHIAQPVESVAANAPATSSANTATPVASPAPAAAPPADAGLPEVSVAAANAVPDIPTVHADNPSNGFSLRTTTRLVDVSVVAYDKKGRLVRDLTPNDIELYDNGVKQQIESFVLPPKPGAQAQLASPPMQSSETATQTFSNTGPHVGSGSVAPRSVGNTTILMIDAANLAFGDLNYTRSEMLRFLKTLAFGEPVGVYVLKGHGFQVLLKPTTDVVLTAETLKKWMPDAQDLANAQDEEQRNRREVEYVDDVKDLFAVNGNSPEGKSAAAQPTDPQLRAMGSDPARDAFLMMPAIAQSLTAIPGHKSLVWISSDNALADWSDKAVTAERGNTLMDPLALKAEEAMNNAHVSIYPLDASQLEAGGVAASAPQSNVQLNPAAAAATQAQLAGLPPSEQQEAEENLARSQRDINPGRIIDTMKQDMHPIQGPVRELADATGGHALRRAGDIAAELSNVVADGDAVYLLSFSPSGQPDDTYHHLTVKLVNHPDLRLRYRTGYLYAKEPATLKDRFRNAVWSPVDMSEIALAAHVEPDAKGDLIRLKIAAKDLDLKQAGERWNDQIAIFIAERDDSDLRAHLTGKTLALALKPATYQDLLRDGINFEEKVAPKAGDGSFRVVVVDENSGRMGSVTIPIEVAH